MVGPRARRRAGEDSEREIRDEHDLTDHPSHHRPDQPANQRAEDTASVVEATPDDIRDTSTPDPSEYTDPAERGRRPLPDQTADILERAQAALVEIEQRARAEDTARARAAQAEPDDDTRSAELTRWAEDDTGDDHSTDHRRDDGHEDGDDAVLQR